MCTSLLFERMGYYGSRVILFLFLIQEVGFEEEMASSAYGNLTHAIYLIPLLLAPLFDFVLKPKFGAMAGGFISAFGCFSLPFLEGSAVYVALLFIAFGVSSSRLGTYATLANSFNPSNNNRDVAFGIVYFVVNIGATLSTFALPWLAMEFGFQAGFIAAGICFVLSSLPLLIGGWWLGEYDEPKMTTHSNSPETLENLEILDISNNESENIECVAC